MLGARDRMGRHEMHGVRQVWPHVADDGPLHRADIGNDGAVLEMRRDLRGDSAANADGDADNDEIGAFDRFRVGRANLVGNAEFGDACACLRRPGTGRDGAHGAFRARGAHDRRADQARADNGHRIEQRFGHWPAPMNSVSALSAAWFSCSVPMVMRKASGKPYSPTRRRMMRRSCKNLSASCADLLCGKCTSRKFAALGVTVRPMPVSASAMVPSHAVLCATASCCLLYT